MSIFTGTPSDAANHMAGLIKKALSPLPDPTVTGPCQAQATFMCTGEARGEHLNPLAMLPGSEVSTDYVPMCLPCKEHLSDQYVTAAHKKPEPCCDAEPGQPHTGDCLADLPRGICPGCGLRNCESDIYRNTYMTGGN